ncbi:MAG: hypothetical protein OHK005_01690 [Candidatus Methylacidiphilales bacterium]
MHPATWTVTFHDLYNRAISQYREGKRGADTYFSAEDKHFLCSIGAIPQELYDFAEDYVRYGEPDYGTALLITAARRDYFLYHLKGASAGQRLTMEDYPAKEAEFHGIPWLPRITLKAKTRLEGTMPLDMMYGCGGDRAFFMKHRVHAADFLRIVWSTGGDLATTAAKLGAH